MSVPSNASDEVMNRGYSTVPFLLVYQQGRVLGDALVMKSPPHEARNKPVRFLLNHFSSTCIYVFMPRCRFCYLIVGMFGVVEHARSMRLRRAISPPLLFFYVFKSYVFLTQVWSSNLINSR